MWQKIYRILKYIFYTERTNSELTPFYEGYFRFCGHHCNWHTCKIKILISLEYFCELKCHKFNKNVG